MAEGMKVTGRTKPAENGQAPGPAAVPLPLHVYQAVLDTIGDLPWKKSAPLMHQLIQAGQAAGAVQNPDG